jgi:PAS domain S-box-containing protein
VLIVAPHAGQTGRLLDRMRHEYGLKGKLESEWAARPLDLMEAEGRPVLLLEDPGGEFLEGLIGQPMEIGLFLRLATALATALAKVHRQDLIHKDIKPAHILVDRNSGTAWFTGFGFASLLRREQQAPAPPQILAGTLAYMAPEQTGRMNRSVDARSDLYSLGVTFYQMLTGDLPFTATDPIEWVHCHIARKPDAPIERVKTIPAPLSAIVVKLLAKTAEERYQTASGLEKDLSDCLAEWEAHGRIGDFTLADHDAPDQLLIPEKLYGREREIEKLLAAFGRVVKSDAPELALVSGCSGVGKSSVVNELHKVLVPLRGLFASGKFDQYKRDIPYSTLAQAFQKLVNQLLCLNEAELDCWRAALPEALGPNGQLIVDLVPELKLIIGEQPPVPELEPQQSQGRFQLVIRRFIGVFARAEHPLTLFLDDLQWLDAATLDLLEDLFTKQDVRHLLVIGAYRDNEVDAAHPLMRKLDAIQKTGAAIEEISLAPLRPDDLTRLVADSLRCEGARARPLALLLHSKTAGNPLFAIQFLSLLAEEELLVFDHGEGNWSWDLDCIRAKGFTDNVVDLMTGKLIRLSEETQNALRQFACIGSNAQSSTLSLILGMSEEEVHASLSEAARQELIQKLDGSYKFAHDRVQEAAYSLIPEASRAEAHLKIGRLLAAHTPEEKREEAIFEIVNQLNRGAELITSHSEREELAQFNLIAAKRAKASTAYASALAYLSTGSGLLPEDRWERRHDLAFTLDIIRAECEFLTGEMSAAEQRLMELSTRAEDTIEQAAVACLRMDLCTTLGQFSRAVAAGLDYLKLLGIDWRPKPTDTEVRREYERVWSTLGTRKIEELVELPLMSGQTSLATLDVLIKFAPSAFLTNPNLASLVTCRAVNLSLEHGNSDASCYAYVSMGRIAGSHFGNYEAGFRFGRLGYELGEQRGLNRFRPRILMSFAAFSIAWARHIRDSCDLLRRASEAAHNNGDFLYAAFSSGKLGSHLFVAGARLADLGRLTEDHYRFVERTGFKVTLDDIASQLALVRTLRGLTGKFGCFDDEQFAELQFERSSNRLQECWYWIRKLQARYFAGEYAAAIESFERAQPLLWTSMSFIEVAEYHFYGALCHAACSESASSDRRLQHLEALADHQKQLELWAQHCPENFENRAVLVSAEIARIEGRAFEALRLYERANRSARANGFIHNEALALELAGQFHISRDLNTTGIALLREARACYARWGADGKVKHLDQQYPQLKIQQQDPPSGAEPALKQFDLANVAKASQALSSEIELPKLIEILMTIALECAGADRGLLMLPRGSGFEVEVEAKSKSKGVEVNLVRSAIDKAACPESVVNYVIRTEKSIIIDDSSRSEVSFEDAYLRSGATRSVFCLPLLRRGQLAGVLYLENTQAICAFTQDRTAVLDVLAAQAAISLENARLYGDLREREARIRRLVDSNIIGVIIWTREGRVREANDAFLALVGYDRQDIVSKPLNWIEMTPPEWNAADRQALEEIEATGSCRPFEKEYFRKDGSRAPVLIGAARFEGSRREGVAFVLDLSERRDAEDRLRRLHLERLAAIGGMAAGLAHELNQPLTANAVYLKTAKRLLQTPPDQRPLSVEAVLDKANEQMMQAGRIVSSLRRLASHGEPDKVLHHVHELIVTTCELLAGSLAGAKVQTTLHLDAKNDGVLADGIQIQQVLTNLITNAREAMSASPRRELTISTSLGEVGMIKIDVKDTGPGIPEQIRDRVFDPALTTKDSGMGVGLSMCRMIVEAHYGTIWAEPESELGATFSFTLPMAASADTPD